MQPCKNCMSITEQLASKVLSIFSTNLVAIPPLFTVKYIQAKKHFLIIPQNQTTPAHK